MLQANLAVNQKCGNATKPRSGGSCKTTPITKQRTLRAPGTNGVDVRWGWLRRVAVNCSIAEHTDVPLATTKGPAQFYGTEPKSREKYDDVKCWLSSRVLQRYNQSCLEANFEQFRLSVGRVVEALLLLTGGNNKEGSKKQTDENNQNSHTISAIGSGQAISGRIKKASFIVKQ